MKRRNLKTQLKHVVCTSKRLSHSKRAERKNGVDTEKYLYSINSTKKMFKFCTRFADWMKVNHPEIKWVRDIEPAHFEEFCRDNLKNWSNTTRKEYQSRIHKLGKMVSETFHIKRNYSSVKIELKNNNEKAKNPPMEKEDFKKLSRAIQKKKTSARYLPDIAYRLGTRSEEARSIEAQDINLEKKEVLLRNCKNGRKRKVKIRNKDFKFFKDLKEMMIKDNWPNACNGMSENGCNKIIRQTMKECGISDKYRQSIHAIRKLYAVERMKEEQRSGKNWRQSWEQVQKELGHGSKFRGELAAIYLGDSYRKAG